MGFFLSYLIMELRLAALQAARAPLIRAKLICNFCENAAMQCEVGSHNVNSHQHIESGSELIVLMASVCIDGNRQLKYM